MLGMLSDKVQGTFQFLMIVIIVSERYLFQSTIIGVICDVDPNWREYSTLRGNVNSSKGWPGRCFAIHTVGRIKYLQYHQPSHTRVRALLDTRN